MTLGVRGHLHHSQQPEPAPTALGLATRPRGSHRVPSTHHPGPRTKPSDSSNSADQALTWLDATEGAASRAQEPGAPHADGLEPEPGAPTRPRPAAPSAARAPGSAQRVGKSDVPSEGTGHLEHPTAGIDTFVAPGIRKGLPQRALGSRYGWHPRAEH
ncbi:collagen alpha-1(VII) chain-like isoform X10 [Canis lupus familiaris]|uniref:collagen alpha-1(VII) chain-like isoform X2 n=1 Tax=Canis lupus dingo TaxID=286419 RepID=UPI0015F12800|nr:collagen alpha-1(VII) chain-like isoform X2 [Canis lupus dingo]XP_038290362.1 collagen alpha-1(VII) chain-like isoform X2 [Canis lupus familiaris]XP_038313974.1 collagen alpha-1(VII) chain-like isoform X10 [Canis lupus familiaris]XP_038428855.1 collagen alpha-1(VII) chain-like isoform X8 [Canis lupus familiaris]